MTRPQTMKAMQITALQHGEVIEMPVPEPEAHEVLAQVLAVVTCNQFDLHIYEGRPMLDPNQPVEYPQPPGFPGHEWVGEVIEVGPGVTELHLGDWICIPGGRGQGRSYPGAYAQYRVCNESIAIRVPKGMSVLKLAPVEMSTCISANILDLKAVNAIEGKRCGVSGLGPAGLIAAQLLRAEGAEEVIGVETSQVRRAYALAHGVVDRAVDPLGDDGRELPLRRHPAAIQVSMDCAGAKAAVQYMMDHTSEIVSLFAVQREPYTFAGWYVGLHQGLKVFGTASRTPPAGEHTVRRVKSGAIDLSVTVTHKMGLADYNEALALIKAQKAMKVCFFPHGEMP